MGKKSGKRRDVLAEDQTKKYGLFYFSAISMGILIMSLLVVALAVFLQGNFYTDYVSSTSSIGDNVKGDMGLLTGEEVVEQDPSERLTETLTRAFQTLDISKDGKVSLKELDSDAGRELEMNELGGALTYRLGKINGLIGPKEGFKIADIEPVDGLLSFEEWLNMFMVVVKFMQGAATAEEQQRVIFTMRDSVLDVQAPKKRCYAGPTICRLLDGPGNGTMQRGAPIDVVPRDALSPALFYDRYLSQNKPVLIKGDILQNPHDCS